MHDDCEDNQFCKIEEGMCNEKKIEGVCLVSRECKSGICDLLSCKECTSNDMCPEHLWCDRLASGQNCKVKKDNGSLTQNPLQTVCLDDRECKSGICELGFCSECRGHNDCPGDQYCDPFGYWCKEKKDTNLFSICVTIWELEDDRVCKSGHCTLGICADCKYNDDHCPGDAWCVIGACIGPCWNDEDCPNDYFCSSALCTRKKGGGEGCWRDAECASNNCFLDWLGKKCS